MVSASYCFAGRVSTAPPKHTPSIISLEPLICLWEAFVNAGSPHPPKEKYFTFRTTTPWQSEMFSLSWFSCITRRKPGLPFTYLQTWSPGWTGMLRTSKQHGISTGRGLSSTSWLLAPPKRQRSHTFCSMVAEKLLRDGLPWRTKQTRIWRMMQTQCSRPLPIVLRKARVTGRPGMNIYQTSNRPNTRPQLNWTSTSRT